jgi:hypothetical protein
VLPGQIMGHIHVCPVLWRSVYSVIVDVCQLNGCDMQHTTSKHPMWYIPPRCSRNTPPLSKDLYMTTKLRFVRFYRAYHIDYMCKTALTPACAPSPQWQRGRGISAINPRRISIIDVHSISNSSRAGTQNENITWDYPLIGLLMDIHYSDSQYQFFYVFRMSFHVLVCRDFYNFSTFFFFF